MAADPLHVGSRLPSPYYERVVERKLTVPVFRRCTNCGYRWTNQEIPLWGQWEGARANCCPVHKRTPGKVVARGAMKRTIEQTFLTPGVVTIIKLGGAYTRYECSLVMCHDVKRREKRIRWTTGEFCSDGIVVKNAVLCPQCGAKGRKMRTED